MYLLNDVLDFSKIEAKELALEDALFNIHKAISETARVFETQAAQKGLELLCDIASDIPAQVVGDSARLRQILVNLLGNAIKFTSRGRVTINAVVESKSSEHVELHIAVRDTGIGIPKDKHRLIFLPFAS